MKASPTCNCASKWQVRWEEAAKAREFALNEANEWKRKYAVEVDKRRDLSKALVYFLKQEETNPTTNPLLLKKFTAMLSDTADTSTILTPTLPSFDLDYDDDDESTDDDNGSFIKASRSASDKSTTNGAPRRVVNLHLDEYPSTQYDVRPVRSSTIDIIKLPNSPRTADQEKDNDQNLMIRMLYARPFRGDANAWHVPSHSRRLHDLVRSMTCFQPKKERVFEHFLITGLLSSSGLEPASPDDIGGTASWKPKVLFQYPPASIYPINEQAVSGFCFPVGVPAFMCSPKDAAMLQGSLVSNWTTDAPSTFRQLLEPFNGQCYTFRLTGSKGEALYGFCAAVLMDADEPPILLDKNYVDQSYESDEDGKHSVTPPTSPKRRKAAKADETRYHSLAGILASPVTGTDKDVFTPAVMITPRCYCFTSKYPFYNLHFHFLRLLIETDLKTRRQARMLRDSTHEYEVVMTHAALGLTFKPREDLSHSAHDQAHEAKLLNAIASPPKAGATSVVVTEGHTGGTPPPPQRESATPAPVLAPATRPPTPARKLVRSHSWSSKSSSPCSRHPGESNCFIRRSTTCAIVESVAHAAASGISVGDVLTAINGFPLGMLALNLWTQSTVDEMAFPDILQLLETSKRPIKLRFKRLFHKKRPATTRATSPTRGGPKDPIYGSPVLDLLRRFRSMPMGIPGAWSNLKLPHTEFQYQFPTGRTDEWTIGVLLRLLDPTNIVKILACLLLEKQVAIVSESTAKLSVVNSALLALLRPYQWQVHHDVVSSAIFSCAACLQSTFIPILPSNLLDFLHSPVPYLVGVHPIFSMDEWPDVCFVNVDRDSVDSPFTRVLDFPNGKQLTKLLHDGASKLRPMRPGHPWHEVSDNDADVVAQLALQSEALLSKLCGDLSKLSLPPQPGKTPYDVLQEEFFKVVQTSQHRLFMSEFAQTQLFCQYCEHVMHVAV
ncbi:Aste57867_11054 [Aphanomyces stellatus]|uniref:Aste57867_11054 protein n=1 Tax=Aphanomyces stellatus TaxID=120398 RepID=A0A485KRY5_9STRA|nr:hypothetical protein As57867_011012 [Aphanomyces stellatus]VFT87922.1 Aste57867_11054 [Aphanomyces stellatus]